MTWLNTNFEHCRSFALSKEIVLLGYVENIITDRILDLFIVLAKQHIYASKLNDTLPNIFAFLRNTEQRFLTEKYVCNVNNQFEKFVEDWKLYSHFFKERCSSP